MDIKDRGTLKRVARILVRARFVTVLTGAGISTPSGIPDFRSRGSGLWERADPFRVASIYAFRQHPEVFYDWVRPLARKILDARPNAAHIALAELGKMGIVRAIITQNIDGLHQRAGSQVVFEVHGHLRRATCLHCYASVPAAPLVKDLLESGAVPRCQECGGVLKPDIILIGEQLPAEAIIAAQQAARKSDVMLVAGSSLEVAPAGDLPLLTKERGGKLIIVNLGQTYLDDRADLVIRADVAEALPEVVRSVRELVGDKGLGPER
jgi:NAD-dependent deacetylase